MRQNLQYDVMQGARNFSMEGQTFLQTQARDIMFNPFFQTLEGNVQYNHDATRVTILLCIDVFG